MQLVYNPLQVSWSGRWRLLREQHELKTPQEHALRDEETEAVPAESVHLERKETGYIFVYLCIIQIGHYSELLWSCVMHR